MRAESIRYAARCLVWSCSAELMRCPSCGSRRHEHVARKALVTQLARCHSCRLLYRRPQEPSNFAGRFYEDEYQSGLTTELPDSFALASMLSTGFKYSQKDLADKLAVLPHLGVTTGARVLDFGASWGYGVWQLNAAGYRADGFEISRSRADWGSRNLGVAIHADLHNLDSARYDAVFSNHVLEHIPDPGKAFDLIDSVLKPGGWLLAYFPNGSDACRRAHPARFHKNWGRLHPVYLNNEYCERMLADHPLWMSAKAYDAPANLEALRTWDRKSRWTGDLSENEMMLVARF